MIAQLTKAERTVAMVLSVLVARAGLAMATAARQGAMAVHGFMALAL